MKDMLKKVVAVAALSVPLMFTAAFAEEAVKTEAKPAAEATKEAAPAPEKKAVKKHHKKKKKAVKKEEAPKTEAAPEAAPAGK